MTTLGDRRLGSSFRDPSGFIFERDATLYRQINQSYSGAYDQLMQSGLYESLVAKGLLVRHKEVDVAPAAPDSAYKVIQPELVPFISYPYEWCFSALKSAARATLAIHQEAIAYGMALKDASAYNIQFRDAKPVFIDTLSFEPHREDRPWVAYQQFCKHFLAPLALMAKCDIRCGLMLRDFIDGIPLDFASKLLPWRSRLNPGLFMHVHLHARSQTRHADDASGGDDQQAKPQAQPKVSKAGALGILESLDASLKKLNWSPIETEWGAYYEATNYSDEAMHAKQALVTRFVEEIAPACVWDVGGNTGRFSRIASERGIPTVSFDIDPVAIETSFRNCTETQEQNLLPLLLDLANPSPSIGWQNQERDSMIERGPVDMVLALALVHHLALSNNVPLSMLAEFFAKICRTLVIEFVPKEDSQVRRLLATREDVFPEYQEGEFRAAFEEYFEIREACAIEGSARTLFLMTRSS